MARAAGLSQWTAGVSTNLPHLTKPQATVLALWSYGIAITRSCGRGTVATFLALLVGGTVAAVEQRLYEWCIDAPSKLESRDRQATPPHHAKIMRLRSYASHGFVCEYRS